MTDVPTTVRPAGAVAAGRPRRTLRRVALSVGAVVAVLVAVLATRQPADQADANSPLLGQPAPAVVGPALDGGPVSLDGLAGHYVVLNFFASWCAPCHQELPQLVRLARADPSVRVLGVVFDDTQAAALRFLTSGGAGWPSLADPDGRIALEYGVRAPPESYLISPNGTVVAKIIGGLTAERVRHVQDLMSRAAGR